MSDLPPNEDPSDDELEQLYRRASSRDVSRPSDSVRNAVLRHAADLARDRAASNRSPAKQSWRRPVTYGGLAAAGLAGLLIAPHFLPPPVANLSAARTAPGSAPAPLAQPAPMPDVRALQSEDVAAQAPSREAAAKYRRPTDDRAADASGAATGQAQAPSAPRAQYRARESLKAEVDETQNAQTATAAASAPRPADSAAALRQAAALGEVAQLNTLLSAQPDLNARDAAGRTALMVAVLNGQSSAVEALLARGADANARDAHGTTPLQAALANHQQAIAASLRRAGAH